MAIKTIKHYESETERENFLKEMNVMSKLMHPNIVRLFGLVEQGKLFSKLMTTMVVIIYACAWLYR